MFLNFQLFSHFLCLIFMFYIYWNILKYVNNVLHCNPCSHRKEAWDKSSSVTFSIIARNFIKYIHLPMYGIITSLNKATWLKRKSYLESSSRATLLIAFTFSYSTKQWRCYSRYWRRIVPIKKMPSRHTHYALQMIYFFRNIIQFFVLFL